MRKIGRLGQVVLLIIGTLALTGCFDRSELEEQAFLVTMGVDQLESGTVALTARIAVPSKLTGSSGGGGGGGGSGDFQSGMPILTATGRTLHEALALMNVGVERKLNLSHLSAILFSDHLAKQGLLPYLRTLVRYREFRRTLFIFVTKGDISDVFLRDRPMLETSATRLIEDLHELSQKYGYAPSVQMHDFLNRLETPHEDAIAPLWSLNPQVAAEKKKESGSVHNLRNAKVVMTPGEVNRAGGNPIECIGTAVFRGDRMVGQLDGNETRFLQLLNGSLNQFVLTLSATRGNQALVSLGIRSGEPIRVSINPRGKHPTLLIKQSFEADLFGDRTGVSFATSRNRHLLEARAANSIRQQEMVLIDKVYRKFQADPFQFFDHARGQFATVSQFDSYPWRRELPFVSVNIMTKVNIRRLGTQLNPLTVH